MQAQTRHVTTWHIPTQTTQYACAVFVNLNGVQTQGPGRCQTLHASDALKSQETVQKQCTGQLSHIIYCAILGVLLGQCCRNKYMHSEVFAT